MDSVYQVVVTAQAKQNLKDIIEYLGEYVSLKTAEGIEANQYREKRQGMMEQLNERLADHHLKIVVDEKAA